MSHALPSLAAARRLACLLALCLPLATPAKGPAAAAGSPAEVFAALAADRWITRDVSFSEIGLNGPLVLGAPETRREIYLPVPANVGFADGEVKLDANYMRADGGRTSLVLSLDGYPVSARAFTQDKGDASLVLGVDGAPQPGGFMRLGLNWNTALANEVACTDARTAGNLLRIEPDSRFRYRYDGSAIRDLTTAWGALASHAVILIASPNLGSESYDSAWRMGLALERAGKHGRIRALPAPGELVDLDGLAIAPGLRSVPAFAALAQGGTHKLGNLAEVGALLSLGAHGPVHADILIADKAMTAGLTAAFDALRAQLQTSAPDALAAFDIWRARGLNAAARTPAPGGVELAQAFGQPAIVVAADAGVKAAGLFGAYWNRVAVSPSLRVQAADEPEGSSSAVSLQYLGGQPGSIDVLAHADWSASFDIGAVAADGRVPATLLLDVAAAPSAARTAPVVSIFMNDILLGAKQLAGNGKAERISASIPRYALAARNVLRLSFVRQMASDRCRETPEAYPVSVLPSSHMLLEKATPQSNFTGMVSRYAAGAHVMVPAAFLSDAATTLPLLIRLAASTGISPLKARFTAISGSELPAPGGAFLALELPMTGIPARVKLDAGRLVMTANTDKPILDVSGLDAVGILEIVQMGGDTGVVYRNAGAHTPALDKPMLLARGDVAIIGAGGLLAEINSADPGGRGLIGDADGPWLLTRGYWWMLPIVVVAFMVALLVFASRVRRRRKASIAAGNPPAPPAAP